MHSVAVLALLAGCAWPRAAGQLACGWASLLGDASVCVVVTVVGVVNK